MRRLAAGAVGAATAVLLSIGLAAGPMDAGPDGAWGVTWATAPSAAVGNVTTGYAGFTIRNVVHTVLNQSGVRTVIIFEGINDIQQNPQQTDPAKVIAGIKQLRAQAKARGLRVIGATIMPWQGWGSWTPQLDSVRVAVNAWIRTGQDVDGVADFDAATRDPANPQRLLPAYDSGDHLHPNDAGGKGDGRRSTTPPAIDIESRR